MMALGAMAADPTAQVKIVPVGLSYFHAHRFRSRAVVEFGAPLDIPPDLVNMFQEGGAQKREAVSKMLDLVFQALKTVTIRAPDYETLMVSHMTRALLLRLYLLVGYSGCTPSIQDSRTAPYSRTGGQTQ